jgi:sporulation protein YlmC with PRC-barrel domain
MEAKHMKKIVAGFVAVLLAAPLIASAETTKPPAWKNSAVLHETKDIIGTRIKNTAGKDLGEIDQLLIDRNGKVSHVVIGVGGLAGVGEKKVVVPWSELKFAPVAEGKKNAITMNEAKLESAPVYDRDAAAAASPRTRPASSMKDSDRDGKSDRTDKAPLDSSKK